MSPCIGICNLNSGICRGCFRTLDEITGWKDMAMSDRESVMRQIKGHRATHHCPECGHPSWCAMENGNSVSACWCSRVTAARAIEGEKCLCRRCLCTELTDGANT
ncbi:cysteine-rich CWC family protein [Kushneria phosphatilytica]